MFTPRHFKRFLIPLVFVCLTLVTVANWHRLLKPSTNSPEDLLQRADEMAWFGRWQDASPLFSQAEERFAARGDQSRALYAKVSQIPPVIETSNLPPLIADLNRFLSSPTAAQPDTRLRILTVKGMAEYYYDAAIARETWRSVEALATQRHEYRLASRASGEQGILAFLLGNIDEAKKRVTKAYVIAKYLGDPTARIRYASVFGSGLVELRRYNESLYWLDDALGAAKQEPRASPPITAYLYKIDALSGLSRYKEAQKLAEETKRYIDPLSPSVAKYSLLTTRGLMFQRQGDVSATIREYTQAAQVAKQLTYWRGVTSVQGKLAKAFEQSGDLPKALLAIDDALQANKAIPGELYYLPNNLAIKAEIQAKLGRRQQAEDTYLKGADIIDALLMTVPTRTLERQILSDLDELYSGYFALKCESNQLAAAFRVMEKVRGRIEAQRLQHHAVITPHAPTRAERQLEALRVALLDTDDQKKRESILKTFYQVDELEVQQDSSRRLGEFSITQPLSLQRVQRELRPGELLIEYVLRKSASYALAITRSSSKSYRLPDRETLETRADKYRTLVRNQQSNSALANELFHDLLGSIDQYKDSPSVIIIPDGKLHLLPFSALVDDSGQYAIATHTISITLSGTVFGMLRDRATSAPMGFLGVAPWIKAKANQLSPVLRSVTWPMRSELVTLPGSQREVESIAELMPKPSDLLLGTAATKPRFLQLPLSQYAVLHLALHGYADMQFPDRSALLFAPTAAAGASTSDAGMLSVSDILQLRLNASLVTLSACNTGLGPVDETGVDNIVDAFIQAGAHTVVSTLWELPDQSTTHLMQVFYGRLAQHKEKAQALREAQLNFVHSGLPPYYWASFQAVGDPAGTLLTAPQI
jgi:CHAT domain-containing protein